APQAVTLPVEGGQQVPRPDDDLRVRDPVGHQWGGAGRSEEDLPYETAAASVADVQIPVEGREEDLAGGVRLRVEALDHGWRGDERARRRAGPKLRVCSMMQGMATRP